MARSRQGLRRGDDGVVRCWWPGDDPLYVAYHDTEWGRPREEDHHIFKKVCLEGFQAGLSWITILRKRPAFRVAFRDFDIARVARFNSRSVERLLGDASIVRHRGKIESAINNARRALEMIDRHGSLAGFFWRYEPAPDARPRHLTYAAVTGLTETAESEALSRELRRLGWTFVGPVTMYAHMQATGMVNDHLEGCDLREPVERARAAFTRPA